MHGARPPVGTLLWCMVMLGCTHIIDLDPVASTYIFASTVVKVLMSGRMKYVRRRQEECGMSDNQMRGKTM